MTVRRRPNHAHHQSLADARWLLVLVMAFLLLLCAASWLPGIR